MFPYKFSLQHYLSLELAQMLSFVNETRSLFFLISHFPEDLCWNLEL